MSFYRYPSPLELTYIAHDTPSYSPYVNQFFVEGVGELDLSTLQAAVEKASTHMIETRMRLRGYGHWRFWDDEGPLPKVYEVDGSKWDALSNSAAPVLGAPMNVRRGPVCEVVLMRGNPLRILFRTHHSCTDGSGTIFFIKQVFRQLRGEALETPNSTATEWDIAQKEGPVQKAVLLGGCKPVFKNNELPFEPGCHWRRILYPGKPTSITGKLMSILTDISDPKEGERIIFRIPSDLRRYSTEGTFSASNCSSALDVEVGAERSPKKLQHLIITAMRNKQDIALIPPKSKWLHWFPLRMMVTPEKSIHLAHRQAKYPYSCAITNIGQIQFSDCDTTTFKCTNTFGINMPLSITPLTVSVFQCELGTWLNFGMPNAVGTPKDLKSLSEQVVKKLDEMESNQKKKSAKE